MYNKLLHLLQCESTGKSLGMNTKSIYFPSMRMQRVLQEFKNEGITRIEISYSADSVQAENILLHPLFAYHAAKDIGMVLEILNYTSGIGFGLSMMELLQTFEEMAKRAQLFIEQPTVAALVYASNPRSSSYCGFFKHISKTSPFNRRSFLAANALPGPGSVVHCII